MPGFDSLMLRQIEWTDEKRLTESGVFVIIIRLEWCGRRVSREIRAEQNMEMYRSGRNENDSKSNWLFGSGFPVLLGFMRVFRLRERTIFGRSLLKFSPKFSRNARCILRI